MYVESPDILRCADAVSLCYWFPTFRKILMQLSSKAKQTKNNLLACLTLDTPEDCLSNDRASNPGRHEPKAPEETSDFVLRHVSVIGIKRDSFLMVRGCTVMT